MPKRTINSRPWQVAAAALALGVWACTDLGAGESGDTGADPAVERELLESVASLAYGPSYAELRTSTAALVAAVQAHETAVLEGGDVTATLGAARAAWTEVWSRMQVLELMPLGPAGNATDYLGGEGLRDELYSWPSTSGCRVDQELVAGAYDDGDFFETRLVNVYGLDALEYLLFWESDANSCAPQLPINAEGQWDALGTEERARRRASYARAVAVQLDATAASLADRWSEGGDLRAFLGEPGAGSSPWPSTDAAMNDLSRAFFYAYSTVREVKVGAPGGIVNCTSATCLDALESPWAQTSKDAVLANLEGFRRVYYGGMSPEEGFGFDDALASIGRDDLAMEMSAAIDGSIAAVQTVEGSFREALLADEGALDDAYAAIKVLTDLLKTDFTMALALDVPTEAGGDAD